MMKHSHSASYAAAVRDGIDDYEYHYSHGEHIFPAKLIIFGFVAAHMLCGYGSNAHFSRGKFLVYILCCHHHGTVGVVLLHVGYVFLEC